jgi:hypothetical protein
MQRILLIIVALGLLVLQGHPVQADPGEPTEVLVPVTIQPWGNTFALVPTAAAPKAFRELLGQNQGPIILGVWAIYPPDQQQVDTFVLKLEHPRAAPVLTAIPLTPWPLATLAGPTATEEPTLIAQTAIPATFVIATPTPGPCPWCSAPTATPTNSRPTSAYTATVEWDILAPSPPGPARTLLLDGETPGLGPIEHANCATWQAGPRVLTLYDRTLHPNDRGGCSVAIKSIRRISPTQGVYALTWPEGSGPFFEHLLYPGDVLPVTVGADGGVRVQLP